jgi:hypothetical protein
VEHGERLSRVSVHSIGVRNFDIKPGEGGFGEIFMLTWEELL